MRIIIKKIAGFLAFLIFGFIGLCLIVFLFVSKGHSFDLSDDYRQVDGWTGIVFRDNWADQDFKRCFWGIRVSDCYSDFQEHMDFDRDSFEYKILSDRMDTRYVTQIVLSPDGKNILFVESIYRGTGVTDDEDVYYRVYEIEEDYFITIYEGFREFFRVDWKGYLPEVN